MDLENFGVDASVQLKLKKLMKMEIKQHIAVYFTFHSKSVGEITQDLRDKTARANRLVSHIFDLPSEIFITSIIIMDRYISRIQVKPNQINIVSLSSLNLACTLASNMCQELQIKIPSQTDIIQFLEEEFEESDFYKMTEMISKEICNESQTVLTPLAFKRIFDEVMAAVAIKLNLADTFKNIDDTFETEKYMEIVACDSDSMIYYSREIALCISFIELNQGLAELKSVGTSEMYSTAKRLRIGIGLLQALCKISNNRFSACLDAVNSAIEKYSETKVYTSFKPRTSATETIQKIPPLSTVSESDEMNKM